jgi:hypothetical protein
MGAMPATGVRVLARAPAAAAAAGLAGALVGVLAGCAAATQVTLPSRRPSATAASAEPARMPATHSVRPSAPPSARQLVIAAYRGYWQATNEALDSRSPHRAGLILARYVPRIAIPALVKGFRALWRHDEIAYGAPVLHVMSLMFTGRRTAAVHDCIDMSHAGFQDWRTGQVVGGLGQPHDYLITTLALEHGRWLVTDAIAVVRPCAY